MKSGYKDILIIPSGDLTKELINSYMNENEDDEKVIHDMPNDSTTTNKVKKLTLTQ